MSYFSSPVDKARVLVFASFLQPIGGAFFVFVVGLCEIGRQISVFLRALHYALAGWAGRAVRVPRKTSGTAIA